VGWRGPSCVAADYITVVDAGVDAPNAGLIVSGNGDVSGRVVGKTIICSGNGKFHFDTATALAPQSNSGFALISFREITYWRMGLIYLIQLVSRNITLVQ
jgi:hypothetical protein